MILKIFKGVWFISMLVVVANLLYVYAGLPEDVIVGEEGSATYVIGREPLFYSWLAIICIANTLVYLFTRSVNPDEAFRSWFIGFIITLNIFFVIGLSFIGLYNSSESFDFGRAGVVIYLSLGLTCIWLTSWPIIVVLRKLNIQI
jgi:hypothetical protein